MRFYYFLYIFKNIDCLEKYIDFMVSKIKLFEICKIILYLISNVLINNNSIFWEYIWVYLV